MRAVAVLAILALGTAGCATLGGSARVRESSSGQIVVEARSPQTFDELARQVYGDASLGRAVAEASRLSYDEGVPRGALLVLPPQEKLQDRVALERRSDADCATAAGLIDDPDADAERFFQSLLKPARLLIRSAAG